MHSPPQTECIVTGTLSFVLRMSRIAGVAPLNFEKTHDGWRIRVSPAANCYGQILGLFLTTMAISAIVTDMTIHPELSFRTRTNSTRIVWVADVGVVGLVVCAAAFTGLRRMRCLIVYLLQLQKISCHLNVYEYNEEPSKEKQRMLMVIGLMALTVVTIVIDFTLFIHQVVSGQGKVFTSSLYIFYNIASIVLEIILIQFSQIVTSVLSSLQALNNRLKNLLQEIHNDAIQDTKHLIMNKKARINAFNIVTHKSVNSVIDTMAVYGVTKICPKSMPVTLRRLALLYCSICDVVLQVNNSHGAVLITLMLSSLLHLVITPYHVITNIFNKSKSDQSVPILQLMWFVLHFTNLLSIIEPCHRTHEETDLTKHLISQMTRYTSPEHGALLLELEMFYRHLMLNEVIYAPLKMFSLNRTLIVTILGSITTYLVVIVQL